MGTDHSGGRHTAPEPLSRVDRAMLAAAEFIVRRHKAVIAVWVLLIIGATPFAMMLPDALTKQGASKVVEGTPTAEAERLIGRAFPHRSERQVFVTVSAPDVRDLTVRQFLADLDAAIATRVAAGDIVGTTSPYTVYRDATSAYLRQAAFALREQAVGLAGGPLGVRAVWPDVVAGAVGAGSVPADLGQLLVGLGPDPGDDLAPAAGRFAVGADWRRFPVPLPDGTLGALISPDADTALVAASFSEAAGRDPDVSWLRSTATDLVARAGLADRVRVHVTGELALIADTYERADRDNALMEAVAYAVIAIVLILFFRAVMPAVLTMVLVGLAMNVSQAALWVLGQSVTLTQFTVTIMTFVMLGAGVDYSMLLSSRYRQQRVAGRGVHEAIVRATASAGESVLLAAVAVVIAFGVALLSPVDWVPPLGYGGLIGIPIIFVAVLTLTPSLLALLGDRFFCLGIRPMTDLESTGALARALRRLSDLSYRRRRIVTALFLLATIPFGAVVAGASLSADPVALSAETDSSRGFAVVAREWGKPSAFPTVVVGAADAAVATGDRLTAAGYRRVGELTDRLAAVPGVARVEAVTRPFGTPWSRSDVDTMPVDLRRDYVSGDGVLRIVTVLDADPYSAAARHTVERVQAVVAAARPAVGALVVGGSTAVDHQYDDSLNRSFWQLVLLVSLAVSLVLVLALRSVVIPLQLVATIMLSNVWAIGITVFVFDRLLDQAIINDLPVFLIILMMGLGMDYEIFLVTRIRELAREDVGDIESVRAAVVDTGRVIGAAGLVMTGSLGAMVLSSTLMLRQYGVGLGTAVLLDATVIRMLLVPSMLLLLRRVNWWLPRLCRRRPRHAEGRLRRRVQGRVRLRAVPAGETA
jgi:putative drug exporter of the RND superfamily